MTISKEKLTKYVEESYSLKEVLNKLGIKKISGGNRITLKKKLEKENILSCALKKKTRILQNTLLVDAVKRKKLKDEDIFTIHSKHNRTNIKQRIINDNLIPYICRDCNNEGVWNNKKISLQLEHINGVNDDYRLENLCFLCPNCHSQTETFAGKNSKQKQVNRFCERCGNPRSRQSKRLCLSCAIKENGEKRRKFNPTKEELIEIIKSKKNLTEVAKYFGVNFNSVKKRCKLLEINYNE
jgi:Zn finger protein HypA/HybF involved in hydrogenase expression